MTETLFFQKICSQHKNRICTKINEVPVFSIFNCRKRSQCSRSHQQLNNAGGMFARTSFIMVRRIEKDLVASTQVSAAFGFTFLHYSASGNRNNRKYLWPNNLVYDLIKRGNEFDASETWWHGFAGELKIYEKEKLNSCKAPTETRSWLNGNLRVSSDHVDKFVVNWLHNFETEKKQDFQLISHIMFVLSHITNPIPVAWFVISRSK